MCEGNPKLKGGRTAYLGFSEKQEKSQGGWINDYLE